MTFKEKLRIENPKAVHDSCIGGVSGCPYIYEYESFDATRDLNHPCQTTNTTHDEKCALCWNREIPGTEPCEWCETAGNLGMHDAKIGSSLPYKFCPMCGRKLDYQKENVNAVNTEVNKLEESK